MELLPNGSLHDWIEKRRYDENEEIIPPFNEKEVIVLMKPIVDSVYIIHTKGDMIHKDIKPDNIFVSINEENKQVQLN